jgi:hypothetical protein
MKNRKLRTAAIACAAAVALGGAIWWLSASDAGAVEIVVYKTPTCGCCAKWADHLRANGFSVKTNDLPDVSEIKRRYGIARQLSSCHTAIVEGYVIEGHVPADVIRRLLEVRPPVVGLTVPGMPMGSPGMEASHSQPYEVLTFDADGKTEVFAIR